MNTGIAASGSRIETLRSAGVICYLASIIAFFLIFVVATVTGLAVHFRPSVSADILQFAPEMRGQLLPEPGERAAYLSAIVVALPAAIVAIVIASLVFRDIGRQRMASWSSALVFYLCAPFAAVFIGSDFISYLMGGAPVKHFAIHFGIGSLLIIFASLAIGLGGAGLYLRPMRAALKSRFNAQALHRWHWTQAGLTVVVLLTVIALRVRTAAAIDQDWHFEPVFYAMSQVMAGKTLIADLPSQYGLFAEVLRPLFAIIGLSVLKFTVVMVLLQGVGSFALLALCGGLIRLNGVRLLAGLSLFWIVGSTWAAVYFSPYGHEYFQVWPIRFLFPALSAALFFFFRRDGLNTGQVIILAAIAGLSIVWNLDSGVPTAGALIAYLLIRTIFGGESERLRNSAKLAIGIAMSTAVVAAFLQYLSIKANGHIHLGDWIKYQRIFYAAGFGMLPLPRQPHPWLAVLGLYLFGLIGGIFAQIRHKPSLAWDTIFYLSILGLGLFTYYQGRSDAVVLTFVVWPAIVIAFALADRSLRAVRAKVLPEPAAWGIAPILIFGTLMSLLWILGAPKLVLMTVEEARMIAFPQPDSATAQNIAFIKARIGVDKSAVILAPGQAVYYGETGLASNIDGPSIAETILLADQRHVIDSLKQRPAAHLFIQLDKDGKVPILYRAAVSRYRAMAKTPSGLEYLVPDPRAPENTRPPTVW